MTCKQGEKGSEAMAPRSDGPASTNHWFANLSLLYETSEYFGYWVKVCQVNSTTCVIKDGDVCLGWLSIPLYSLYESNLALATRGFRSLISLLNHITAVLLSSPGTSQESFPLMYGVRQNGLETFTHCTRMYNLITTSSTRHTFPRHEKATLLFRSEIIIPGFIASPGIYRLILLNHFLHVVFYVTNQITNVFISIRV